MKIIDAVWEKRNLGVDTIEIEIEDADCITEGFDLKNKIVNLIDKDKYQYYVLKFDAGNLNMYKLANELGFSFAEMQFDFAIFKNIFANEDYSKIKRFNTLSVEEYSDEEHFDYVISKINDSMFYSDRISLDPYFGVKTANLRYLNWVKDLKKNRDYSISLFYNGSEPIGFSLNRNDGDICFGLLGGLFSEIQSSAWGLIAHYSNLITVFNKYTSFRTSLSSNNIKVIKLWQYFSAKMLKMRYVYVKHV